MKCFPEQFGPWHASNVHSHVALQPLDQSPGGIIVVQKNEYSLNSHITLLFIPSPTPQSILHTRQ